jgi:hypothetical protein
VPALKAWSHLYLDTTTATRLLGRGGDDGGGQS